MESLLVLVGLVILAIPVTLVILLVSQVRLRRRVEQLEAQIAGSARASGEEERAPQAPWTKAPEVETAVDPDPATADVRITDAADEVSEPDQSTAAVFRQDRFAALVVWLRENWFYAVSALSLALAGIFLVQYGIENGLLPPSARVAAALGFGAVLIIGGELIRRRFGDDEDAATAYLPSVFSGAGLVTLFGGLLAARQQYDLIGPETALICMILVALVGLGLGWFHGPLLAAVGLLGGFAAPFLVGGTSEDPTWLYGYAFVLCALGLGIDTVRRWAWISVLALAGGYVVCLLLVLSSPITEPGYLVCVTAIAVIAIAIPNRRVVPDHSGSMVVQIIGRHRRRMPWPEFPTRLAFGVVAVTTSILSLHWADSAAEFWLGVALLVAMLLALIIWAKDAPALQDMTALPGLGLIWFVLVHGLENGAVKRRFAATYAETAEADFPMSVTLLVSLGALISLLAAWRSFRAHRFQTVWAGAAVLFAPMLAITLEVGWRPAAVIGAYPWALHAIALAVLMVGLAERFARVDGQNRMRTALAALSALSALTFACVIVLSSAALTIALVGMIVTAAALDRRFNLPTMSWFIWAGVLTVTVRLVLNPGLGWANTAPVMEMSLVYSTATAGFLIAWWLLGPMVRPVAKLLLESAAWASGGILLSLLLLRWLEGFADGRATNSHWGLGLLSVIWLLLAYAQVQRFKLGGKLNYLRYALAVFFASHGLWRLFQALVQANPVITTQTPPVLGPPVLNTLAVAYLLPAIVVYFSAWRITTMPKLLRQVSFGAAAALAALWLGLSIRHFWQGAESMFEGNGVTQPELYTYTIALLVIGAVLFYQSLASQSYLMRKAGLVVIGLAVVKVFLIDIAGLGGLIRVFSLLALGLSLAGLAWLNRWARLRYAPQVPDPLDH